ncbi:MAG: radical SAM protein [Sedimentisphaerales bacterium]|nr:radical SAM protein [Sedimentisphaerales bacterium]
MINISKLYSGLAGQSDELRYAHTAKTGPIVVYNCTAKCNLRCLHCYSASDASRKDAEMTTEQAKKFIAELPEINAPVLLFSGGEPLLRGDLFELLAEAKRLRIRTVISTNGILIDEPTAGKLKNAGLSYIGISLDGAEPFHDKFRQKKGAFNATIKGIQNCQKIGLRTGLRFTITKSNASQIPLVFDIAVENEIKRLCFYHLIRSGRATEIESEILTGQQTRDAVDTIIQKTDEFVRPAPILDRSHPRIQTVFAGQNRCGVEEVLTVGNHADGPYLLVKMQQKGISIDQPQKLLLANGGNRIGQGIVCVNWKGDVFPDQFWQNYSLGNVMQRGLREIWTNPDKPVLKKLRNKDKFADKRCLRCKWFNLCKGNFRFLGPDPADENWLLEPACYLTDNEIGL